VPKIKVINRLMSTLTLQHEHGIFRPWHQARLISPSRPARATTQ